MVDVAPITIPVDSSQFDKAFTAASKLERKIVDLERARQRGMVTDQQYIQILANMSNKLDGVTTDTAQAAAEIQRFGNEIMGLDARALNNLGRGLGQSQKGFARFSLGAQQAGYQIGDFAVQVASGTNWLVAFAQQASQLLGFIGPWGAVLGAVVAIGAGIAMAFTNASDKTNQFEDALKSLKNEIRDFELTTKAANLGLTVDQLISSDALKQAKQDLEDFKNWRTGLLAQTIYATDDFFSIGGYSIGSLFGFTDEQMMADYKAAIGQATSDEFAVKQQMMNLYQQELNALSNKLAIEQAIVQFGKDSQQVKQLEADQDRASYLLAQQKNGITGDLLNQLMKVYDQNQEVLKSQQQQKDSLVRNYKLYGDTRNVSEELKNRLGEGFDYADDLSRLDFNNLSSASDAALKLAARLGIGLDIATRLSRLGPQGLGEGNVDPSGNTYSGRGSVIPTSEDTFYSANGWIPIPEDLGKSGGGGSKSDPREQLLSQYNALMGSLDPLVAAQNQYNDSLKMLNEALAAGAINQTQFQAGLDGIKKRLEEAQDPLHSFKQGLEDALSPEKNYIKGLQALQSSISEFLFNPFEVGLDGMVLSFSRALQKMASEALAAQFMQMFIGSMGGGVGGWFSKMFADGGAFSGGREIKAFATGGVVGGPTFFPMAGGKTGLMGEAGPEAIMPLKRTSDGKLGIKAETGGGERSTKIINVLDPRIVGEYLNTPDGEEVIMNVMRRTGAM